MTTSATRPGVGAAARLDEKAAAKAYYEHEAAAAQYAGLLVLLREARAALGPEWCGYAGSLAGRIDDVLFRPVSEPGELVLENYGGGFAWLRAS